MNAKEEIVNENEGGTMKYRLLSIDPGLSSGAALLEYAPDTVPELLQAWQFKGGAQSFDNWVLGIRMAVSYGTVISEKFTARNTRGFSYTTASLEPLRCEGVLLAHGLMPDYSPDEKRWRDPALQYLVGGKDLADKKKRMHRFLKETGFYVTGKKFETHQPDADDARSAIAHALSFLVREEKHKPTFELMSDWSRNAETK